MVPFFMTPPDPGSSPRSNFSRDVITLVQGTSVSLIITILASPIITRLYGPEAFGLAALFTSITGILGVIACLSYEPAIVLPKTDEEAANVFGLCLLIVVCVSLATIPFLYVFQQPVTEFLKAPQLGQFIWLIPPTLMVSGSFLALNYWNTRTKHFNRLSIARITSSFTTTGTQLGSGFLGFASGGILIYANILGQCVSTGVLGLQIMRDHLAFFKQNITGERMAEMFKRYSNFPKYQVMGSLINTLSWQIPIFLLSYFFSKTIVGYYSLGMMVIMTPMTLIGAAIAQVFFQRAAMAKHDGSLSSIFTDTYSFLVKISLFPLLLLTFIGKDLFVFVFGPLWGDAGFFIQILSVFAVSLFISSPLSSILSILGKQKIGFILSSISLALRFFSLYIGGIFGSAPLAILLFSLSGMVGYGSTSIFFMHLAGVKIQNTLKILFRNILVFLPAGIIMVLAKILNLDSVIEIMLAAFLLTLYFVYLLKTDQSVRDILGNFRLIKRT
jgi:O-antigen/teichoic acid export membrane protein